MHLHENKEAFLDVIIATSDEMGIPEEQIEKDYYVSYLLEHIVREVPNLVFKGGTSLSKCYNIIKRFSEDIDLHFAVDKKPTASERKQFKRAIEKGIENSGLILNNGNKIKSGLDHNIYEVIFPQITDSSESLKKELIVETYVPIKTFPCEKKEVTSYILQYLTQNNELDIIDQYKLQSFLINVQRIDRTFIDKIFAVCDYYEMQKLDRNSRHIYDIHMIFQSFSFNEDEFRQLFESVRKERQQKPLINVTSVDGYDIVQTLKTILDKDAFKEDYLHITLALLFEEVTYEEVKNSMSALILKGLIPAIK